MSAQTGYVADALVAELVRAAHERGVRAGLEAAATVAEKCGDAAKSRADTPGSTDRAIECITVWAAGHNIATDIRSLDPATIKEDADGRE